MVVTAVSGTDVTFTWTAPDDNEEPIIGYELKIRKSDGTYLEDTAVCDGTALLATRVCTVSMATLRAAPYSLTYGTLAQAIVSAENSLGSSSFSQVNTAGATIQTVPTQMGAVSINYAGSSLTTLAVTWSALTGDQNIGGSAITSYWLEYSADVGVTWSDVQG